MCRRPFCEIGVFNARIKNRIEKARHHQAGPTQLSRRRGYTELRVAMQVQHLSEAFWDSWSHWSQQMVH